MLIPTIALALIAVNVAASGYKTHKLNSFATEYLWPSLVINDMKFDQSTPGVEYLYVAAARLPGLNDMFDPLSDFTIPWIDNGTKPVQPLDAVLMKMHTNFSLVWATVVAGKTLPIKFEITIDPTSGDVFGTVFIKGPFGDFQNLDPSNESKDIVYMRFNGRTGAIMWSEMFGSAWEDTSYGITIFDGYVYLVGAVTGPIDNQPFVANFDGYITKINPNNGSRVWTKMLGSAVFDSMAQVVGDPQRGTLFIFGSTGVPLEPGQVMVGSSQSNCFVSEWDTNGTRLWSSLLGDKDVCIALRMKYDPVEGQLFVAGVYNNLFMIDEILGFKNSISFVASFWNNGTFIKQHILTDSALNLAEGIAFTKNDVIICGYTANGLFPSDIPQGNLDTFVAAFSRNIDYHWSYLLGGAFQDGCTTVEYHEKSNLLYVGGVFGLSYMHLVVFNLTELERHLPFPPWVPPAATTDSTAPTGGGDPLSLGLVPLAYGDIIFIVIGTVATLTAAVIGVSMIRSVRRLNSQTSKILMPKINSNQYDTCVTIKTSRQSQIEGIKTEHSFTMVPEGKQLSIPGAYAIRTRPGYLIESILYSNKNKTIAVANPVERELIIRSKRPKVVIKEFNRSKNFNIHAFHQELSLLYWFVGNENFIQLLGFMENPFSIITDYYPLGSLDKALYGYQRSIELTKALIVQFATQIAHGIQSMHQSGFSHSDLKPHNIFVDVDVNGRPKCILADLGLAQILNKDQIKVKAYQVKNLKGLTVYYAAPEVIQWYRRRLNDDNGPDFFTKADIYSYGCLIYEMLTSKMIRF